MYDRIWVFKQEEGSALDLKNAPSQVLNYYSKIVVFSLEQLILWDFDYTKLLFFLPVKFIVSLLNTS